MDEEFESLVVTDPELVDPGIDISGLRTQTDVSPYLLGNIPDYAGIQYEAFNPTRLTDLMRLYSTGLPMIDTPAAAVPPATGGGGTGDGGQATIPTDDFNQQEFEENLIDQGVGLQIAPGQPVVAPGEIPVTNLDLAIDNDLGVVDVDGEGEFGGLDEGADPDRIQANEFADIESPTGIGPTYDEAGLPDTSIPDRNRGQIPVDTRVTKDFEMPRGGGADIDIFDTTPQDSPITIQNIGPGREVVQPDGTIINIDPLEEQMLQETLRNELEGTDTFTPTLETETIDAAPNIVTAKPPVGVVDPFDGKYTMSTAITPEDTEQSITNKIADFLGVDTSKINKAAVTGALNLVAGKALDTVIPIATVFNLVKDAFVRSPEQEAAEEQARQDRIEEAAEITRRIEEEDRQRRETEAREAAAARAREEAAQRAREEAARAAAQQRAAIAAEEDRQRREREAREAARQRAQRDPQPTGGGADRDPAPSRPAPTNVGNPFGYR